MIYFLAQQNTGTVQQVQTSYSGLVMFGLTILVLIGALIWWLRR
jgi:hypothetical protein